VSKKTFVVFGLVVVVLAVAIPWIAFRTNGDAETGAQEVPASLKAGQSLFQTNCGTCHTLYAAGTDGNYGPDLDELLAPAGPPEGPTAAATIKATEGRVRAASRELAARTEAAWESFYDWAATQCWGSACEASGAEQFATMVAKLKQLGLPAQWPLSP